MWKESMLNHTWSPSCHVCLVGGVVYRILCLLQGYTFIYIGFNFNVIISFILWVVGGCEKTNKKSLFISLCFNIEFLDDAFWWKATSFSSSNVPHRCDVYCGCTNVWITMLGPCECLVTVLAEKPAMLLVHNLNANNGCVITRYALLAKANGSCRTVVVVAGATISTIMWT